MASGGLVDITTACYSQGVCNVLGVVVDALPLFRTRGSSACVTFTIKDSDFDAPTWRGGLKVKYFNDNESYLPNVKLKDVVLLRNARVTIYQNKPTVVVSQQSSVSWVIFRPEPSLDSNPFTISGPTPAFEPSLKEKDQAQSLLDRVSAEKITVQQSTSCSVPISRQPSHVQAPGPAPKSGGLPYIPIQAAKIGKMCQLLGQVVSLNTYDSQKCLLYLTDFTENEELVNYKKPGDEDDESGPEGDRFNYIHKTKNWPGPWGKLTIEVALWEPHATYARQNLKAGDIALLTYARIKECRRGLEAAVHEDRKYPEKIHVRKMNGSTDERVQELMSRRTEYWKIYGEPRADTKKAKKRNKKVEQEKEARKEGQLTMPAASRIKLNKHVKTKNYTVPNVPLEKILLAETHINNAPGGVIYQLPFQNVNYHSQVRVIDFFPPRVEDFAVQTNVESKFGWEWRFCLLVEGVEPKPSKQQPREVMKLYAGSDKEKLFLLWGNLEEEKSKAMASGQRSWGPVKSCPFECCIKEYGVQCTHRNDPNVMDIDGEVCTHPGCFGWERRFALFGTTIHT
ncbi:Telomere end binding protein [Penicillium cf. griseofulvum]|nr:Telomere end binding protein [Penicillium cf. griseofulvum]